MKEIVVPMNLSFSARSLRSSLWAILCLCSVSCTAQTDIRVLVHGLPAERVRVEQEDLGELHPEEWRRLQARGDVDGVDTGDTPCSVQVCRGLLITLFMENPTETAWAPPLVRVRRPHLGNKGLPVAFSGYEISPKRTGRLRLLVHAPRDSPTLSLHLSHSVSVDISGAETPPPTPAESNQGRKPNIPL